MATGQGLGIALVFGTTGFTANVKSIVPYNKTRGAVDKTHLASTGTMEKEPADLGDHGEMTLVIQHDPDIAVPIDQPAEVITGTYPLRTAETVAANFTGNGFVSGSAPGAFTFNEYMESTITITWSNGVTENPAT